MAPRTRMAWLRPFTVRIVSPILIHVAGRLPGFGILEYRGRKSGRVFRTPINVFRDGDDWIFALTYGSEVQWVKNVLAAGGCTLTTRGRTIELTNPRMFDDPTR